MDRRRIVCFGDSLTWGYHPVTGLRIPEEERWTGTLQRLLGSEYQVIEEGQNSRTIATDDPSEGEKNGRRHIIPCVESHKPLDILIIWLGTNDMKTRYGYAADSIAGEMEQFLEKVQAYNHFHLNDGMKVVLIAPPLIGYADGVSPMEEAFDFTRTREISAALPERYRQVAETYGCRFLDVTGTIHVSRADGVHLEPPETQKMGETVYRFLKEEGLL